MVALAPDGGRAFVANIGSGSVSVLDLAEGELVKVIPTGAGAEGIAVHPTRPEVWVTNRAADTLSVIDATTLEVAAELPCAAFPIRVALTPDGRHALVSCARSGDLAVFDVETRALVRRVAMDAEALADEGRLFDDFGASPVPVGILIRPDGSEAFVANTNADVVTVIDLASWRIARRLRAGKEPDGMAWARLPLAGAEAPEAEDTVDD
jgi:YVTN family beta-propeller protein